MAGKISDTPLPHRIKKHRSILIRKLGDSDRELQINKVTNLKIASREINGILIRPGETFSFCKLVGLPTAKKGYLLGMELSNGVARPGIGGGICQISNLIHWIALHTPLKITERKHHSFDPFPDENRVLPFGSGATVFYNYIDLQFYNSTKNTFQILLWLTEDHLCGEIRALDPIERTYYVYEDKHEFLKIQDRFYRKNEIWRRIHARDGGALLDREYLYKNFAEVKYRPETFRADAVEQN